MTASFNELMVQMILSAEASPTRFEDFCCKLFSTVDRRCYVPTSRTYDGGVDGRAADLRAQEAAPVICASTRKDAVAKAEEDATRIQKTGVRVDVLRFCSTQPLSEILIGKIKATVAECCPEIQTIRADGLAQIASLSVSHPACFEQYYLGEITSLRSALGVNPANSEEVQLTGMRIALTTQLSADAQSMREDLHRNLVLTVLSDGKRRNISEVCSALSEALRLPLGIQPGYLQAAIDSLSSSSEEFIECEGGKYTITAKGHVELRGRTEKGTHELSVGQGFLRQILHELTGQELQAEHFASLWVAVQDEIANMFLSNGIYIAHAVSSILGGESDFADHPDLHHAINALGDKVAALAFWGKQSTEIGQAVVDAFHERNSDAFKWLSGRAEVYVCMCCLGLNESSQEQIADRLRELSLLLDTDVLLSFLSAGEPNHEAVSAIVACWKQMGGSLRVTRSVLEETAYHAWISERDYQETWRSLGTMSDAEALRLVQNAFVRSFRVESNRYHQSVWRSYIGMFRGSEQYDCERLSDLLKEDGILALEEDDIDEPFAEEIASAVLRLAGGESASTESSNAATHRLDKCRRDGKMMAAMAICRQKRRDAGLGTAVVVSSSGNLAEACNKLGGLTEKFGKPEPVVPVGALAQLLALVPGVAMSLETLRAVLFDPGTGQRVSRLEQVGLRALQNSEQYLFPFSRRAALKVAMRERITDLAREYGRRPRDLQDDVEMGGEGAADDTAKVVAEAIDSIVSSKSEKKITELQKEVDRLKGRRS